jgi:excisionase family DNA binding protein
MTSSAMKVPSTEDARAARVALELLDPLLRSRKKRARTLQVRPEGTAVEQSVTIPTEAFELFVQVLAQMANGNPVAIVPVHAELTTQQAAEMLNVSRPFLVGLLDEKVIPYRMVGSHRRVRVADLLAYRQKDDAERQALADELAAEAQKHRLGY